MVTDEALVAETAVWPNFFLMDVFFALKGSKLFIIICHPRGERRGSHISTLSPSIRQQSDITQCYTVRKQLSTLNTLNSTLVGYLSFPGSVETLIKRLGQLVYCWK